MVARAGIEPACPRRAQVFETCASTSSAIWPKSRHWAMLRILLYRPPVIRFNSRMAKQEIFIGTFSPLSLEKGPARSSEISPSMAQALQGHGGSAFWLRAACGTRILSQKGSGRSSHSPRLGTPSPKRLKFRVARQAPSPKKEVPPLESVNLLVVGEGGSERLADGGWVVSASSRGCVSLDLCCTGKRRVPQAARTTQPGCPGAPE